MNYVEYDGKLHGKLTYPEGFEQKLEGLSIEEQINYFRIGNGIYRNEPIAKRRTSKYMMNVRIDSVSDVKAAIIHKGKIAGIMVEDCYGGIVPCLPEQGFVFTDESEQDGSGYKNHTLYLYLICVSEDFDKKD